MAYAKPRTSGRYTAIYQTPGGRELSAGTFDDEDTAFKVAQAQEAYARTGSRGVDPLTKATRTIGEYWEPWLRSHPVQPSTKQGYEAVIRAHILPRFKVVRVAELQREAARQFLTALREAGASPSLQRQVRACLSAMMQTAWDDGYRSDNPVRGLRIEKAKLPDIIVMTQEQFAAAYEQLASEGARLFANFIVSTGCRFGEAAALLVDDIDFDGEAITFSKALQDVGKKHHPDGKSRFWVGPTKTGDERTVSVDEDLLVDLRAWIAEHDLGKGDLVFPRSLIAPAQRRQRQVRYVLTPELLDELEARLGTHTGPNGIEYRHGDINCYVTGKCRCGYCTQACADYRYQRQQITGRTGHARSASPSQRYYDESDFLYDSRWNGVWQKACAAAQIPFQVTAYQLRHTHASWLIEAGENIKTVMDRLGHKDMTTTSRYVKKVGAGRSGASKMASLRGWGKKVA